MENARRQADSPLALYIHWPFCVSKCPYCDFNSHVRASVDEEAWRGALIADMEHEARVTGGGRLSSIFFGGGTPSLMPPALVGDLIERAAALWGLADGAEITLEANPLSVEAARFADIARAGVNRVTLGLQALDDDALRFLGRAHDVAEGLAALDTAQARFGRVNFDLIYARPDQSVAAWETELARAIGFGSTHLSLYHLTIEPGTRFATDVRRGVFAPMADDAGADLFAVTRAMTARAGLPAYEISNHAREGEESRHNLTYWRYGEYVGIGPGAHGRRRSGTRLMATERHRKPENYLSAVARNGHGIASETALDPATRAAEALMMGLRLTEGVDLSQIARATGIAAGALVDGHEVRMLSDVGLLAHEGERLRLTEAGFPLLDAILPKIVAEQPEPVAA